MIDQQAKFTAMGLSTEFVGEAQENRKVVSKVLNGDVQLVFISPENLINNKSYKTHNGHFIWQQTLQLSNLRE